MDTMRLRNVQKPSRIERMLEVLVAQAYSLPKDSYRIRDPNALPLRLQAIVARAVGEGRVWTCWATSQDTWLFTCEMSLQHSRERGAPVLLVDRYDENGTVTDSSTWTSSPEERWRRCED
jgi:hypothetical protein